MSVFALTAYHTTTVATKGHQAKLLAENFDKENVVPQIWVDADAVPKRIRELLIKAAQRRKVAITFVANRWLELPRHPKITMCVVSAGLDKADDHIAQNTQKRDLVITADVPLAARCVEQEGLVVTPRDRRWMLKMWLKS